MSAKPLKGKALDKALAEEQARVDARRGPRNITPKPPADPRTLMTEDIQIQYLTLLGEGYGRVAAAKRLKISYETVRRFYNANPEFLQQMVDAESEIGDRAIKALNDAVKAQEPWAVKEALDRFSHAQKKKGPAPVVVVSPTALPAPEAIAELTEAAEEAADEFEIVEGEIVEDEG